MLWRSSMRLLFPTAALVLLAVSIWYAPRVREERMRLDATPKLALDDPVERAQLGEKERSLGLMLRGYEAALQADPENLEAAKGLVRAGIILSAVAPGQRDVQPVLLGVAEVYRRTADRIDPDGAFVDAALEDWIRIRRANSWFLARASLEIWLAARGVEESQKELAGYQDRGPFHLEFFPYCQRELPAWRGVAPIVEKCLEGTDLGARVGAGVTLMIYRRLYGLGEDLWEKHRRAIGDALIEAKGSMRPNPDQRTGGSIGGQILLGLALYDDPTTDRIIARMKPVAHPYLGRIVTVAQCWSGAVPFESIDFEDRRYNVWYSETREWYFRGVLLRYAKLVAEGRTEEAKKLYDDRVEMALVYPHTQIRSFAHRALAAVHPERSAELHRGMLDMGGLLSVYGALGVPGTNLYLALLPALSSPDPGLTTLAAVGMRKLDAPPPIQLPVTQE